ncbi:hypothetical protein [Neosynechococcus sphagnicola]
MKKTTSPSLGHGTAGLTLKREKFTQDLTSSQQIQGWPQAALAPEEGLRQ